MRELTITIPESRELQEALGRFKQEFLSEIKSTLPAHKVEPAHKYFTRSEIAAAYRISLPTLHKHTLAGCPSEKIGKRRLYDPVAVAEYFAAKKTNKK